MSINDANTKLARRVIGELLCMIFCSFCLLAIDGDLKLMSARVSVLRKLDTALLCALNHFHLCPWLNLRCWCCLRFSRNAYTPYGSCIPRLLTLHRTWFGNRRDA